MHAMPVLGSWMRICDVFRNILGLLSSTSPFGAGHYDHTVDVHTYQYRMPGFQLDENTQPRTAEM